MKAVLLALATVVAAFAGCTDGGSSPSSATLPDVDAGAGAGGALPATGPAEPVLDMEAGVPAPAWAVGDWWSYRIEFLGEPVETYDTTLVVAGEEGGNWILAATDREVQLRAGFHHYPTLGPVAKGDLSHFVHAQPVSFFQWPMRAGAWTNSFRGFDAAWAAEVRDLPTGQGPVPGFLTTMTRVADGAVLLTHGWSPATRYFTELSFSFSGAPTPDVRLTLQEWGRNFTGQVHIVTFVDKVHRFFPVANAGAPGAPTAEARATFSVGEGETSLLIGMFYGGSPGTFAYSLQPSPAAVGASGVTKGFNTGDTTSYLTWEELPDVARTDWTAEAGGAAQGFGFVFFEVYGLSDATVTLPLA